MINSKQRALIAKDLRFAKETKGNIASIIIVSLVFCVVIPSVIIIAMHFNPDGMNELDGLLALLGDMFGEIDTNMVLLSFLLNNIIPLFFLMIPVIATTTMATSSFIGEKEKRTLETLLYSPISLRQIFSSKVLAAFFLSMIVTVTAFILYLAVSQVLMHFLFGQFILPGINWFLIVLVIAPVISLLAVTITCKISAKAQTMEEAFQKAGLLTIPIILFAASQVTGLMIISTWVLLGVGIVIGIVAYVLMQSALRSFKYETLLK